MKGNLSNGFTVMDWMNTRLGLTPIQTSIFACLYDASMHGKRPALFSTVELATLCNVGDWCILQNVRLLQDIGLLKNRKRIGRGWSVEIDTDTLRHYGLGDKEEK